MLQGMTTGTDVAVAAGTDTGRRGACCCCSWSAHAAPHAADPPSELNVTLHDCHSTGVDLRGTRMSERWVARAARSHSPRRGSCGHQGQARQSERRRTSGKATRLTRPRIDAPCTPVRAASAACPTSHSHSAPIDAPRLPLAVLEWRCSATAARRLSRQHTHW